MTDSNSRPLHEDRFTNQVDLQHESKHGLPDASDEMYQSIYNELRRIAGALMAGHQPRYSICPTELVHEAYVKLAKGADGNRWQDRAHFLCVGARVMRHILVDHARRKASEKHGGRLQRVTLATDLGDERIDNEDVLALDAALSKLAHENQRMARVVELRVFAGMTGEEIANVLGVSLRTVRSDWKVARPWLAYQMVG